MTRKNSSPPISIWINFVKLVKRIVSPFQDKMSEFGAKYPNLLQIIQLTFLYFFAVIDLIYSVLNNVFALGYFPEILEPVYPLLKAILDSPFFRIWASPEKVFFLSYVVIEFMVVRSTFKFSKLVKYNILLLFAILMLQGLLMSYWDLLFHRQIATPVAKWAYDQGAIIYTDKPLAIFFFLNTFMFFIVMYFYLYFRAFTGKFATIPFMDWLTDSIAFWLRIKTPTMPFGKRKKE